MSSSSKHEDVVFISSDEEEFPFPAQICSRFGLPSIQSYLVDPEPLPISVDVDVTTLDVIYSLLESGVPLAVLDENKQQNFPEGVTWSSLKEAAVVLQCQELIDHCISKENAASLNKRRQYTWQEILDHQEPHNLWILVDGRVFDCTAWVPLHPGGSTILNGAGIDTTYYFEIYHKTKASIRILKKYLIGELAAGEEEKIPESETPKASEEFLQQLREIIPKN